ncbi:MAG: protein phosphatase 2C domain-containing protein [Synergistaceae bacterium]|nr:protein phosphatase 2C domain-containing protein [Synergistaceae bacterium]
MFTFSETVRGSLHEKRKIVCEDASDHFASTDGKYFIAAVADGHGAESCFRSSTGSKLAVSSALECLQKFAEAVLESEEKEQKFYDDIFSALREQKTVLRQLTDRITALWADNVLKDCQKNPLPPEYAAESQKLHAYGTTLIAALRLPSCLVMIHQGDGRCEVIYSDGSTDQPVPWDERCEANITTSMCDVDAAESFRTCALDLRSRSVTACYMFTDGVEDAYRDTYEAIDGEHSLMGGVHTFSKYLTCRLVEQGTEGLERFLSEFSAKGLYSPGGSGDDVSVAGIVDLEAAKELTAAFGRETEIYSLEERLITLEIALSSKQRKHEALSAQLKEAEAKCDQFISAYMACIDAVMRKRKAKKLAVHLRGIEEELRGHPNHKKVLDELRKLDGEIRALDVEIAGYRHSVESWRKAIREKLLAEYEFKKYDAAYQEIVREMKKTRAEIEALKAPADAVNEQL